MVCLSHSVQETDKYGKSEGRWHMTLETDTVPTWTCLVPVDVVGVQRHVVLALMLLTFWTGSEAHSGMWVSVQCRGRRWGGEAPAFSAGQTLLPTGHRS